VGAAQRRADTRRYVLHPDRSHGRLLICRGEQSPSEIEQRLLQGRLRTVRSELG
jgi:hypothetical protein